MMPRDAGSPSGSTSGGSLTSRLADLFRREGPKGFTLHALYKLGIYRRLVAVGGPDPRRPPPPKLAIEHSLLRIDEIDEYVAYYPGADPAETRRRIDAGEWCCVARLRERLVASGWVARDRVWINYVGCWMELRDDCVYGYDEYVHPEFRGEGFATAIQDAKRIRFEAAGYERITGLILMQNPAASRHAEKRSHHVIGDLRRWRLGPWRHYSLRLQPSCKGPMLVLGDG